MERIYSFAPIADQNSRILILGTMPGIKSLEERQYYAHPQNAFWKILFDLFEQPYSGSYADKQALLLQNGVALWDVLDSCERKTSADSDIVSEAPNPIGAFLQEHPSIRHIFLNGKTAERLFRKYNREITGVGVHTLPSSSPANARLRYNDKLELWRKTIRNVNEV